jgi:hypothetical protein
MDFLFLSSIYKYKVNFMSNLNEELERIKKLMLFESSETENTETDNEETEEDTNKADPGDKNFIVYGDTTIKVSGGWLKDNKNRLGCVKVEKPIYMGGGSFAQGIKKLIQRVKGNVIAEPTLAISLYDEIKLSKGEKDTLVKKWESNDVFTKEQSGAVIKIGRTDKLTKFCKSEWGS